MAQSQIKCENEDFTPKIWSYYFSEIYGHDNIKSQIINTISENLNHLNHLAYYVTLYNNRHIVDLDYENIGSIELSAYLNENPEEAIKCIEVAVHNNLIKSHHEDFAELVPGNFHPMRMQGIVVVRLTNYKKSEVHLRIIKSNFIGRLVTIQGTVVRVGQIKPLVISVSFSCNKCGCIIDVQLKDGIFTQPTKCEISSCRSQSFKRLPETAGMVNWQKIRIQEILDYSNDEAERKVPRTVEVEFIEDLVDSCMVGDIVKVMGIVKMMKIDSGVRVKQKISQTGADIYLLYIDAISVKKKCYDDDNIDKSRENYEQISRYMSNDILTEFSKRDLEFIVEFIKVANGDQLKHLVFSFCPSIYGHELIKAGILLSLVGGTKKESECGCNRADINLIIIGDPGLGKSKLLKAAAACATRSIFVCGNTSSSSGLTVSVVKDSLTGDYIFEAGAMVLADNGLCCIDEFDKMTHQHQALLEALENQEISIAKGGLMANLPARTTVIAAANPVEGHYNFSKTLDENVKISGAMLSRFDLVFLLVDSPDADMDEKITEHIVALHTGMDNFDVNKKNSQPYSDVNCKKHKSKFIDKLRMSQEEQDNVSILPLPLIKKYIAYARTYVKPTMSSEAADMLKECYLKLRENSLSPNATPITARQLESLVRISEARAKIDLREEVTKEDAEEAVLLMKEVLFDKFFSDTGMLKLSEKKHKGKNSEIQRFLKALSSYSKEENKKLLSLSDICYVADDIALQVENVKELVYKLNQAGDLLKKGPNVYELAP